MAKVGRNQPCPCGSGVKAKRCCGVRRGPDPDELARIYLDAQADHWAWVLADHTEAELAELAVELRHLPARDLSLYLPLPRLLPPALERLGRAVAADDRDAVAAAIPDALEIVDTPTNREHLARAVLAVHDDGHRISCELTAAAILDLADEDGSVLLYAGLYRALMIATGEGTTPSGLVVAGRTSAA